MKWLNIEVAILRSPEYVGAEPVERATWLNLLAYCADQENGGKIRNCRAWKDRQWQQTCGITQLEAMLEAQLWEWCKDDLVVSHYPVSKEAELRAKREGGAKGGKACKTEHLQAVPQAQLEGVLQGKGKGKGNTPIVPLTGDSSVEPPAEDEEASDQPISELDPLVARVRGLLRIRPTTDMGPAFSRAWRRAKRLVAETTAEEWSALEGYYAEADAPGIFTRRDPGTLLNHWDSEVAKAAAWARKTGYVGSEKSQKNKKVAPPDDVWRKVVEVWYPDTPSSEYLSWDKLPAEMQEAICKAVEEADADGRAA